MEEDGIERLLRAWSEHSAATDRARSAAGGGAAHRNADVTGLLGAALVAEIVGGSVDPTSAFSAHVITRTGELILVVHITCDTYGPASTTMSLDRLETTYDEIAVVVTSEHQPAAVHFIDVRFVRPLARAFGAMSRSPFGPEPHITFGTLMHLGIMLDPAVAAAWGVRTIDLKGYLESESHPHLGLDRLRHQRNRWGDECESTRRITDAVVRLEHAGRFEWAEMTVPYRNMAATLTDALLASGNHYEPFVAPRVASVLAELPHAKTTSDLFAEIESGGRFWEVSQWPAEERARIMQDVLYRFKASGLETEKDLVSDRGARVVADLDALTHRERSYLMLLAGSTGRASASEPIRRFMEHAGVADAISADDVEIEATVIEAAAVLGVSASRLDHSMWRAGRAQLNLR